MKNISDFFSLFNNKAAKEINKRLKIIEIIKKYILKKNILFTKRKNMYSIKAVVKL